MRRTSTFLSAGCLLVFALLILTPMVAHAQSNPVFLPSVNNPYGLTGVGGNDTRPSVADLDGDGDQDVLTGERNGSLFYYENTAGPIVAPTFAARQENPFGLTKAGGSQSYPAPTVADLDGDGDQDILVGVGIGVFRYYENTAGAGNTPSFAARIENPFGLSGIGAVSAPTVADFDADGDQDVLSGNRDGSFYYFENMAGAGNTPSFAAPVTNPFGLRNIGRNSRPSVADIDRDGDLDVLAGEINADFYFFRNIAGAGNMPSFAAPVQDPFGLAHPEGNSPSVADLDGDIYPDVLAGGFPGDFYYFMQERPTVVVNSTSDNDDIDLGDNICDTGQNNSNGDPECTLRAALQQANSDAGKEAIYFNIPASDPGCSGGTCTIAVIDADTRGGLAITDPVILDGSTQPGSEGVCTNPIPDRPTYGIAIDGSGAGSVSGLNLSSSGSGSVVRGLTIHSFQQRGIDLIGSTNNHIACNFIGTNADGSAALPNLSHGLRLNNGSPNNTIGTDGDGEDDAFEGNLVSGNGGSGVRLAGGNSNIVAGNFIGTNRAGTQALGNTNHGIVIDNGVTFSRIGTNGNGTSDAEERNLLSGNGDNGVLIQGSGTTGNAVAGNSIGAAISGGALGNGANGVYLNGVSGNRVGFAGTGPGSSGSQANRIRSNGGHGVQVFGGGARQNRIRGNQTFSNTGLGIDLVGGPEDANGVTANDVGDFDPGANRRQNTPEIASIVLDTQGDLVLTYEVDADMTASTYPLHIDVYLADSDEEEGQTWLGSFSYDSAVAQAMVTVTLNPVTAVTEGDFIVATATDADGNTSELSAASSVLPSILVVNATDDDTDASPGDGVCDTGQTNSEGNTECTLRAALEEANALVGTDSVHFAIPSVDAGCTGGTCTIEPGSVLPTITDAVVIDGSTQPGSEGVCTMAVTSRPTYGIAIDGSEISGAGPFNGLTLGAGSGSSTLQGLNIHSFSGNGIWITGSNANIIACNALGSDPTGSQSRPNGGAGIRISDAAANNRVGTPNDDTQANIIAFNGEDGLAITDGGSIQNRVAGNAIFGNTGLGIDLADDGVTPNDGNDGDNGPNKLQNFPLISEALLVNGNLTVTFVVTGDLVNPAPGAPRYPARVEFYRADADNEEGQTLLQTIVYNAPNLAASPTFTPAVPVAAGDFIVATATDADGNTSEFSAAIAVTQPAPLVVNATDDEGDSFPGNGECNTGQTNSEGEVECTLRAALEEANAYVGADSIHFAVPASDAGCTGGICTIDPAGALPAITEAVVIDATTQAGASCAWGSRSLPVVIDGGTAGGNGFVFQDGSDGSLVRGLTVHGFNTGIAALSDGNVFQCNNMGSDAMGTTAEGFAFFGLALNTASGTVIGTDGDGINDADEGNLFVGPASAGIVLTESANTVMAGNRIGTNASGTAALGSMVIGIDLNADNNTDNRIGSNQDGMSDAEEANLIAYSTQDGIFMGGTGTLRNAVLGNRIFENGQQGIDLAGVGANDGGDGDEGVNRGQNKPEMTSVVAAGSDLTVTYLVDTAPANAAYPLRVEFFLADSNDQEGEIYLGFLPYALADAQTSVTSTFTAVASVTAGDAIVATATDADGNTSEFSTALATTPAPFLVNSTRNNGDNNVNDGICSTGQTNSEGNTECTLRAAIEQANATVPTDSIHFDIPASDGGCTAGSCTIQPRGDVLLLSRPVFLDATTQPGATCTGWDLKINLDGSGINAPDRGLVVQGGNTTIRGLSIYNFSSHAIQIDTNNNNHIACNILGTDPAGSPSLGNGGHGVLIDISDGNVIGTNGDGLDDALEGNVIANNDVGISIPGTVVFGSRNTQVAGNLIGVAPDGITPLGNSSTGVNIHISRLTTVGGPLPAQANTIAYNGEAGIRVSHRTAKQNNIQRNSIFSNGSLGIDLAGPGFTPNDPNDEDDGPNRVHNYPDLVFDAFSAGSVTLTYAVDTTPGNSNYPFRIEFFRADSDGEEGQTWMGEDTYTQDDYQGCGTAPCSKTIVLSGFAPDDQIVATTTNQGGNTSEFSPAVTVVFDGSFVVTATNDDPDTTPGDGLCLTGSGSCSLRAAIEEANARAGANTIHFNIPASDPGCTAGTCTIAPVSVFDEITEAVVIDGSTQPGNEGVCTTAIPDRPTYGLAIDGSGAGTDISAFILVAGSDGTVMRGLNVQNYTDWAIEIVGSSNHRIQCNFLGTDADGLLPRPNQSGVSISGTSSGILIGTEGDGTNDNGEGNLLSGNAIRGVRVLADVTGTIVAGNYIGTDKTGVAALPNGQDGVLFGGSLGRVGTNGDGVSDAEERNLLSGNIHSGVRIGGTSNVVAGNYIGVDATGAGSLPNGRDGVRINNGQNNRIGTDNDGINDEGEANVIAYNTQRGIRIAGNVATGNQVFGNLIFSNTLAGIDLGTDGSTPNDTDPDDEDTGPNNLQNYPDIDSATLAAGSVMVTYLVDSHPDHAAYPLRIDFYRADVNGQGQHWLGSDSYTEDDYNGTSAASKTQAGTFKTTTFIPASVTPALSSTDTIVATATDADGNTSEFNATPTLLPVELVSFEAVGNGSDVELRWKTASETNNAGFEVQVREVGGGLGEGRRTALWSVLGFVEGVGTTAEPQAYTFAVTGLEVGTHVFRLKQIDFDGSVEYSPQVEVVVGVVGTHQLSAAYPNPFNPQTTFSLAVGHQQAVRVEVYDVLGRMVAMVWQGTLHAGMSRVFVWEAGDQPSGLYFIRVVGEQFVEMRQVTLVK